jgi:hypothetical protein
MKAIWGKGVTTAKDESLSIKGHTARFCLFGNNRSAIRSDTPVVRRATITACCPRMGFLMIISEATAVTTGANTRIDETSVAGAIESALYHVVT